MKSFITSVVALASTFVACEARTIGSRSACGTGGELVTITFDSPMPDGLNITGYTFADPTVTSLDSVTISGLRAESSPNVAFTGPPSSAWPPAVAPGLVTATNGRTFTIKSFYFGSKPGAIYQLFLIGSIYGQENAVSEVPITSGAASNGTMSFVDVSNSLSLSGLRQVAFRAISGGFDKPHALDSLIVQWDC